MVDLGQQRRRRGVLHDLADLALDEFRGRRVRLQVGQDIAEIGAELVLKATKVDGVYSADPKKDPNATRYTSLTFDEAISRNLGIMDATAFALCRDQKLPIKVFSIFKNGALKRVVLGEDEGTLVHA